MKSVGEYKQQISDQLADGSGVHYWVKKILRMENTCNIKFNEALKWGKVLAQEIVDEEERQCKQKELEHQQRLEQEKIELHELRESIQQVKNSEKYSYHQQKAKKRKYFTVLHREARNGNAERLIRSLELEIDININSQDKHGNTPLHLAAITGHIETVKILLNHGAMVDQQDLGGRSPLWHVCEELKDKQLKYDAHIIDQMDNRFKVVTELTKNLANPSLCDNIGISPVQLALEYENITLLEALDKYEEAIALINELNYFRGYKDAYAFTHSYPDYNVLKYPFGAGWLASKKMRYKDIRFYARPWH